MAWETRVQFQIKSYQRITTPPYLTLSIIRYRSRVKWNNLGKKSSTLHIANENGDYSHQRYFYLHTHTHTHTHTYIYIYIYIYVHWPIGIVGRVFANGLGDQGSIPAQVIPKIQNTVLDVSLFKFSSISTFVGYLMPNRFLYKLSILFQTIRFSISKQFKYQNSSISSNLV